MGGTCSTITVVAGDSCASLAARCGISATDFTTYNPSATLCSTLAVGQKVCCSSGSLPTPVENADGSCANYTVVSGDTCNAIALSNDITVDDLETWNTDTWGWEGCDDLQLINICLSTGYPPMPPAVEGTVCGPQVPGTVNPGVNGNLSALNPCPLNACCDIWGQCGTTSDFCTPSASSTGAPGTAAPGTNGCISNCGTEIISGSPPAEFLRVAYFEAFNTQRPCLTMDVRQIDTTKYTHVHFAFLDITSTFGVDISQYQEQFDNFVGLTGIKRIASFGGWAMSTDPNTYSIFRDAVGSSANQKTFASNLVAFVNQYKLDGIDIDWEYPGEQDIPGIPADSTDDGQNLAAFLAVLRSLLPSGVSLSIATPAGYWYLKAFPMSTIVNSLDYVIYMTYDLHGQWDYDSEFDDPGCPAGSCLRSHVNLTETLNALSMITKAGVHSNKLIVGVASYGRSFQMTTAGCTGPLCTFTGPSSGATPGPCTQTAGYIANAEINQIIAGGGVQTFHDDSSDSDILVYDSVQWVAYMDDDTKASRTTTYQGLNMGGVSDWAVDLQAYLPAYSSAPPPPPVQTPCSQVQGWVNNWANYMLDNYYAALANDPGTGEQTGCGCFAEITQAWEEPVVFEAVTNWAWASGQAGDSETGNGAGALASSVFISEEISDSPPETAQDFGGADPGYDDILWAALSWMKYYQYYRATVGKELSTLLDGAKAFIDSAGSTISDDPCPGGVLWKPFNQDTTKNSKNTITNALFIHASTMYYIITGTTSYLTQAEGVWTWMQTNGNERSDGIYFDGVGVCNGGTDLYTYNSGEMLAAAGALYTATGNKDYLTSGNMTLNAVTTSSDFNTNGILTEPTCDSSGCSGNDNAWSFKGITMRGIQYFLDSANDPAITSLYSSWIGFQATAITQNAQDTDGDVGNVWYQRANQIYNPASIGMAVNAANAAVKYGTTDGTFTC
ncbi:Glycoside hydrolase family 18 protein [Mycena sanguinolenta]|uniref:Glycoside hydrolase family 18 protein n=1 Tax=Mycena sanguinolenta TaxID=230812 RepID=A0A8H7CJ52_9AGAR|nr:Glycoside hydrolase family 18 protein [Mycena sanguinolenta]